MESDRDNFLDWGRMAREIIRIFNHRAENDTSGRIKLTSDQFIIIHYIATTREEVNQQCLANFTKKDKSTILRSVDSLEALGLVKRLQDPADRRNNFLVLTKEGYQVMEGYKEIMYGVMDDVFSGIQPQ